MTTETETTSTSEGLYLQGEVRSSKASKNPEYSESRVLVGASFYRVNYKGEPLPKGDYEFSLYTPKLVKFAGGEFIAFSAYEVKKLA